jgi:hypothetical protein
MMSDANKYRREAEECRRNSERTIRLIDREAWLRLAADYTRLAEAAELAQHLQAISRDAGDTHKRISEAVPGPPGAKVSA